jgi:hypothetical protein
MTFWQLVYLHDWIAIFSTQVGNLAAPVEEWTVGGTALTSLMDVERRHGNFLVFTLFSTEAWCSDSLFACLFKLQTICQVLFSDYDVCRFICLKCKTLTLFSAIRQIQASDQKGYGGT